MSDAAPQADTTTPPGAPTPGPGTRVSRSAGHAGGALVLIELWRAFGWAGADHWSVEQAAQRWPAITATAAFGIAAVHNVVNWLCERNRG
jgi:hypothetical protein